ncbi:hypothetical protein [uncultured Pontibacter sp.]|uniref:hypothetical protein n=1 Tax=uncultured Pontibacter sp. TaxID=453356 RepID=UPI002608C1E5|nr:hypothetical protein [uncultured Pontibacter sp.]
MILTLLRYPRLNKLNSPFKMTQTKLLKGEQYLIQTVDKKLALTTHRLILRRLPWTLFGQTAVNLEDIKGWEVKATGKTLYFGLSLCMALLVYFDDSFTLLSGFFLMLYLMTRHNRVHVKSQNGTMVLPLEVEEERVANLIEMVRTAKHTRQAQLQHQS